MNGCHGATTVVPIKVTPLRIQHHGLHAYYNRTSFYCDLIYLHGFPECECQPSDRQEQNISSERGRGMVSPERKMPDRPKACPLLPRSSVGYRKMLCRSFKKCSKKDGMGPPKWITKGPLLWKKRTLKQNAHHSLSRNDQIVLSHSPS